MNSIKLDDESSHFNPIKKKKKALCLKKKALLDYSVINDSSLFFFNRPCLSYTKISNRTNEGFDRHSFSYRCPNID